ncbi:MAG: divalent-cation tolerance protein CutA [Acidiferrobacterales bacterium]|jgi:periplasmic divalent cation tolerance protein
MPTPDIQIVLTTCPDSETAGALARSLVSEALAACVNILPAAQSVYSWKGKIESANEHVLLIKSHVRNYAAIEARIKALHPYELPEIVAVPIVTGLAEYLAWVSDPRKEE